MGACTVTRSLHTITRIALTLLTFGCAVSPEAQRSALASANPCCKSFSELPAAATLGTDVKLDISSTSPVFDFPTGRSHFASVALPADPGPRTLEVRSLIRTAPTIIDGRGGHPSFFPVVTFLDERRQPIGTAFEDKPEPGLDAWGTGNFVSRFPIPPGARIAVVHTLTSKIGQTYTAFMKSPGMTMMLKGGGFISTGPGTTHMATLFESTGTVRVIPVP